ncbi:MAG: hypothetical protein K2Q18_06250, partial [Bdellovibrionales bacterium]|nr:hypothetical protein [Bdellovibrionales bacterium]
MSTVLNQKSIHKFFRLGVLLKGMNALLEIVGGIILLAINTASINKTIIYFTQGELSEDPEDI